MIPCPLILFSFVRRLLLQAMTDKNELIDIIEIVYRGARKGRGLVVSPKDYSTKYKLSLFRVLFHCHLNAAFIRLTRV